MKTKDYISPEISLLHLHSEGVLCESGKLNFEQLEDLDVQDGEWGC